MSFSAIVFNTKSMISWRRYQFLYLPNGTLKEEKHQILIPKLNVKSLQIGLIPEFEDEETGKAVKFENMAVTEVRVI